MKPGMRLSPEAGLKLPRLYPILDAGMLKHSAIPVETFARELHSAGIRFLQYRDKEGTDASVLAAARLLRNVFHPGEATLILNDRAHLLEASGFDGVHIGQEDISAAQARSIIGPGKILGLSTHNATQLAAADRQPVDYLAIGPVFGTQSKASPDPVVGPAGVREARTLTSKPLVAIGGITLENCHSVFAAGADSIALISAVLPTPGKTTGKVVEDFLARIG
jgi:thiamine-phosphate pyrophosphorylase